MGKMRSGHGEQAISVVEHIVIRLYNSVTDVVYRLRQRIGPGQPPDNSVLLGTGTHPHHRKRKLPLYITPGQRAKHIYTIGSTGSGKTKFLENLIRQDICRGNGIGIIDCHGDLVSDVIRYLSTLPPYSEVSQEDYGSFSYERVVLVDPTDQDYSIGFNPLEVTEGVRPYAQALELLGVFKKIWGYWGPRMDELMRNVLVILAETGNTLLQVQPLLTDAGYRAKLAGELRNVEAKRYWLERFDPLSPAMKSQYSEPVLNKTQTFVADPVIRSIIGQRKSTIDFRKIMDQGKILLVNLSKGTLKENALLLGGLLVAKIQMAAMSRTDIPEGQRRPWHFYVDEFQNFATESFAEILSEARKFGLSLIMAHQNLDQVNNLLRASILANVGTQVYFGLSKSDAMKLASEVSLSGRGNIVSILTQQKTREAYLRIRGETPMAIQTPYISQLPHDPEKIDLVRRCAIKTYCRPVKETPKDEIDAEVESAPRESSQTREETQDGINPKFAPEGDFQEGQ